MPQSRSMLSNFIRYAAATVSSLMVFSLYSIVDGLFVARGLGEYAMSAVTLSNPFLSAMFSIAVAFAVGSSTIIAIDLAQGKRDEANALFSQDLVLLLGIGLTITALVFLFPEPLARLLGARDVTLPYVMDYLRGIAPFACCFIVSYNLEILVKTDGYPRIAILSVTCGCVTNCVLDYLAIFVLKWGIRSAATATGLSQLLTCVIYFAHFFGKHTTFHPVRFKMDWGIYRRLIPLGISDGVTELCNGLMIFLFNHTILRCIGQNGLVSYSIIAYANTMVINIMMGVSQGTQPLVSYQYGRQDRRNCRTLLRYGLTTAISAGILCTVLFFLLSPQLVHAFLGDTDPALNAATVTAFRRYCPTYLLLGFNVLIGGFMTAVERPRAAITVSVGRGLILQAGVLLLLAAVRGGSSIWFTSVISESICLAISVFFLRRTAKEVL
ncbi:MAG: MATE family efflux transporter [Clostridiales bacterium]|nr:MATE family efflux transporter [Candidatus Cacconaster stercorequi]